MISYIKKIIKNAGKLLIKEKIDLRQSYTRVVKNWVIYNVLRQQSM
jgi:hypothetical protein